MAFRFQKSFRLGKGVRFNLSKRGLGVSAGIKGFRVGAGSRGIYTTASIPGTGLSSTTYLGSASGRGGSSGGAQSTTPVHRTTADAPLVGCGALVFGLVGLLWLAIEPFSGALFVATGVYLLYRKSKSPPYRARGHIQIANTHVDAGRTDEAIEELQKAQALIPHDTRIHAALAACYSELGSWGSAVQQLRRAVEQNPADRGLGIWLAQCYERTGEYQSALAIAQAEPETSELYLSALQVVARCFLAQEKPDLAVETLRNAPLRKRNLGAELVEIHYLLGMAYETMGDRKKALRHFNRVYSHDVSFPGVEEAISRLDGSQPGYAAE